MYTAFTRKTKDGYKACLRSKKTGKYIIFESEWATREGAQDVAEQQRQSLYDRVFIF